jgi:hypothetical protein
MLALLRINQGRQSLALMRLADLALTQAHTVAPNHPLVVRSVV